MLSLILISLAASLSLCNTTPLTSGPRALISRDDYADCQNLTLGLNASCWNILSRHNGMNKWLDTWNKTTTTCNPGELWANCFMREANVTHNATEPIRCDLIGDNVCPEPTMDVFETATAEVSYGAAAIWGLQQYMTSLYQLFGSERGAAAARSEFLFQEGPPYSTRPILKDILDILGDPVALNLSAIVSSPIFTPSEIGQPSFLIPTESLAPQIVGQTVGYLLQWMMKEWSGAFTSLAADGNLIEILSGQ